MSARFERAVRGIAGTRCERSTVDRGLSSTRRRLANRPNGFRTRAYAFVASFVANAAIAADPNCTAASDIDVAMIAPQIVVVGETHGTREIPHFVGELACSLLKAGRPVMLAIEHTSDEQEAIDDFLASDGTSDDVVALTRGRAWHAHTQFGLYSEAMLSLLDAMRRLRAQRQKVGVVAIDQPRGASATPNPADDAPLSADDNRLWSRLRDRAMANRVLTAAISHRDYTIVSLTGSYHSAVGIGTPADPGMRPMAWWIEQQQPAFVIGFDARSGTAWVCTKNGCGVQPAGGTLFLDAARIDARIALPELTASPPALAQVP